MVTATLSAYNARPTAPAAGEPITPQNYYVVADNLRRELQVAQVVCLTSA